MPLTGLVNYPIYFLNLMQSSRGRRGNFYLLDCGVLRLTCFCVLMCYFGKGFVGMVKVAGSVVS